jgi:translation initiation factor IF-3
VRAFCAARGPVGFEKADASAFFFHLSAEDGFRRTIRGVTKKIIGGANISKDNQINEEIRDQEVRVVDSDGTQLGVMSLRAALDLANEKKLDLVNIAPKAQPPVCRILDYGKYRYEMQKREKEARKKQKTIQIKEIRLSTFIEEHDLSVKASNAAKFLKEGDKVKVSLRFRGRERDYSSKGVDVMKRFVEHTDAAGVVEKKPELEGRSLIMILAPKNDKQ